MEGNFLSDLSQDIGKLFFTRDSYDLIIQAGEGQNMKEFFAHSLILSVRSKYFKAALSKEWARKENGILIFKKPNISPEIIEVILTYLYTGIINFDKKNINQILNLLIATDELDLQKLCDYIQTYLIDNQGNYLRNDPVGILLRYERFENLCKFCIDVICENPKILFESPKSTSLEKDLIVFFSKQDELEIEEIKIWEFVLKWALARMTTQQNTNNLSKWTSDNFNELEKILHDLIPHIRWFQIPAKVFWRKINRFEPIFPKQLYKDIIGHYCDPDILPTHAILPLRCKLSSSLISKSHLSIIAGWIDKEGKDFYNTKNTPYSLRLLYRASRDGFEDKKFHELCDNKGSTIMISKLKNGRLIGGYNPLSWQLYKAHVNERGSWQHTQDSFLFSFTNKEEINSAFIARVKEDNFFSVSYNLEYGPAFGWGWDLIIRYDKIRSIRRSSYYYINSIINTGEYRTLEDYEVFQVVKKRR